MAATPAGQKEGKMTVDSMQVGGTHYESQYQHWNLVIAIGMQYLEAQATRYIARWRKKGGMEDLKKALHYTNKLLGVLPKVVGRRSERIVGYEYARGETISFCSLNKLTPIESRILMALATWRREEDVVEARDDILMLMDEAEGPEPVPATDSNKHAISYSPEELEVLEEYEDSRFDI
jgi:hypothetical protein